MRTLFLAATLLSLAAQEYTFQTFSVQGNPTRVYSLNNRGATVGHYWNGTASVGFKRHAGGAIELIRVPELEL